MGGQRPFAPFFTAPGSVLVPMLLVPAAVGARELLVSPAEGRVPISLLMPVVPIGVRGAVAPGPTFPSLDAPGAGWFCAKAAPESASTHADANRIFFMVIPHSFRWISSGSRHWRKRDR